MMGTNKERNVLALALKSVVRFLPAIFLLSLLAGCGVFGEQPTLTPEPGLADRTQTITATGEVLPIRQATLSFATAGQIEQLLIDEGATVEAEMVIAGLDTSLLDTEVRKAEAALVVAEAQLEQVLAGTREEEIRVARGEAQAANASTMLADAQRDVLQVGPSETEIANARLAVQEAYTRMEDERVYYDWVNSVDVRPEEYSLFERKSLPGQEPVAREKLEITIRDYEAALEQLETLLAGANSDQVRVADAQVWAAAAEYEAAQAQVELLEAGAREERVAVAEASVEQARAALNRAHLAREKAELAAPFTGVVSDVLVREAQYVNPGEPVILLADLSELRVETTDLNENAVASIKPGQSVDVTFDALPGVVVEGTVISIAPRAEEDTGINFTVSIRLEAVPAGVRWGMTAFVEFPVEN